MRFKSINNLKEIRSRGDSAKISFAINLVFAIVFILTINLTFWILPLAILFSFMTILDYINMKYWNTKEYILRELRSDGRSEEKKNS